MGCGCKARAEEWSKPLEARGHHRTAKAIRDLADTTDRIQRAAAKGVRRTLRVPLQADEETDRPRRTVVRGGPKRTEMGGTA